MSEPHQCYDELIAEMPAGLDRSVLRVLSWHVGIDQAISKLQLMADLAAMGFVVEDRQLRRQIQMLRKDGHLICASSGTGGYYLANNLAEYADFAESEYRSKIVDMATTLAAMDRSAQAKFGATTGVQGSLF
jgi:hypothetical protein